jgi:hypothetical protein
VRIDIAIVALVTMRVGVRDCAIRSMHMAAASNVGCMQVWVLGALGIETDVWLCKPSVPYTFTDIHVSMAIVRHITAWPSKATKGDLIITGGAILLLAYVYFLSKHLQVISQPSRHDSKSSMESP